ncbi:MAG TPA: hypothetical protein PK395_16995 [bacterium]|nr:hypothetical protein [bacterium]HQQ00763.1 hypothetical protein [bacterium]
MSRPQWKVIREWEEVDKDLPDVNPETGEPYAPEKRREVLSFAYSFEEAKRLQIDHCDKHGYPFEQMHLEQVGVTHSPGPWYVSGDRKDGWNNTKVAEIPPIETCIVMERRDDVTKAEMEANARLIATAPELLNWLKLAVGVIEEGLDDFDVEDAKNVIKRAEGFDE